MARINIEDELFTDQRFLDLVVELHGFEAALGAVLHSWIIGQKYWKHSDNGIPKTVWKNQRLNDALIRVGIADELGDFVVINGSQKHFGWLRERVLAGKNGGPAAAKSRLENIREKARRNTTKHDETRQTTTSPSYSYSYSKRKDKDSVTFDFESIYQRYPNKTGKSKGMEKCSRDIKTQADFDDLSKSVDRYRGYIQAQGIEPKYVQQFKTFMSSWRDWLDPTTGSVHTEPAFRLVKLDQEAG